jgi:uncharacterized heparinase superfamily protein
MLNRVCARLVNPSASSPQNQIQLTGSEGKWPVLIPAAGQQNPQQLMAGRFTFLNRAEQLGWPPRWDSPALPKLWLYNLHYFDWIWNLNFEQARRVVDDWIVNHRPSRRGVGWEPYPTSLRLMNWTGYFFGKCREHVDADSAFLNRLQQSIGLQANWIQRRLEYHLLANHLLENAAAVSLAGSCFLGPKADEWFNTGRKILHRELLEQIPTDGVHFERSPMYHCRILYVLLLLASTGDSRLIRIVREPIRRMAAVLRKLVHPDGRIALLNDSAFGIYHEPHALLSYASALDPESAYALHEEYGPFILKNAGYYGWRSPEGHYLICNAGNITPDYQPGHSHADIFSFELSLSGQRVIVDSGVSTYEPGADRDYCRSTRAHNTVEIAGQDQSEMWGSFRVARRARVQVVDYKQSEKTFFLAAVHDGYERLQRGLRHTRRLVWKSEGALEVTDSFASKAPQGTVSRLHLHPECILDQPAGADVSISLHGLRVSVSFQGKGSVRVEDSVYCPEFGRKIQNKQLAFYPEPGETEWGFTIQLR